QRGYDPRAFVLIAFGGAGPVHANRLAAELEIPLTLVPLSPGITSALGLLVTDLKHDDATTLLQRVDRLDLGQVEAAYARMSANGRTTRARGSSSRRRGADSAGRDALRRAGLRADDPLPGWAGGTTGDRPGPGAVSPGARSRVRVFRSRRTGRAC